uniref:Uncharacterized protein n=1 Tax=Tanacetum cinerariifolium TaxID=118510 RepID=A0A6L2LAQ0_TANCI|nr:hypothetical protein [Tanacetum cinerariifolium]
MINHEDIFDPTTAMNMALVLIAKAFKLNYYTPTNNNQIFSSNPRNRQTSQPGMNMGQDRQMQMIRVQNLSVQNVRNQNGLIVVLIIVNPNANQNGNGDLEEIKEVNANCILMAKLQVASTSGIQTDNAPVYNSDGSAEEKEYVVLWNNWYTKCKECKYDKISYDKAYNVMKQKIKRLQAQLGDLKGKSSNTQCASNTLDPLSQKLEDENVSLEFQIRIYEKENEHLKTTYKNVFDSIKVTRAQTKLIIDSMQEKFHNTIYENATLRVQLFDKVSEQKNTTKGTSVDTKFSKQSILKKPHSSSGPKLYSLTRLPKSKVIPKVGIFSINPFKASRVNNFVPNKHVKASVRTKPITVSQPHVITKKDVNSNTNGFSPKDVERTTKTRRPQPRNNPKNDKVPSKSKSNFLLNNLDEIEETHRNLQSSTNQKHTLSACNNIKLAVRNEKSEVICTTCKKCLITVNHDECVLQYVNGMISRQKNQSANVSKSVNQKKHKENVKKSKKLGSEDKLASSRPSKSRTCLKWLPVGRIFDLNYALWEVILNGDSPPLTRSVEGVETPYPPTTVEKKLARKNELKARGTLLMVLPNEHQLKFNSYKNANLLCKLLKRDLEAIRSPRKYRRHFLNSSMRTSMEQAHKDLIRSMIGYKILPVSLKFIEKLFLKKI